jgi:ABC-2 type transport system permease protein
MMSVLQNAFANSSSSLIQSKITGNIVFILLPPISHLEFFAAYVLGSVVRGLVVGAGVLVVTVWFVDLRVVAPAWVPRLRRARRGAAGQPGTGRRNLRREDRPACGLPELPHLPLTFLSGVFYSIHSLPEFWQRLSHANRSST